MRLLPVLVAFACGGSSSSGPGVANPELVAGAHRTPVDGVEVSYEIRGKGPVCFAHPGGPGMDAAYLRMPMLEQRFTMVYIDPLGTGSSGKLPAGELYSLPRDVKVIEALRVKLGLERVCLIGHSYGGFVVQQYAVDHPKHVSGLFLYSTTPTTEPDWEKSVVTGMSWFKEQPWFADSEKAFGDAEAAPDQATFMAAVQRMWPMYFADWSGHRAEYAPLITLAIVDRDVYKRRPEGKNSRFDVRAELGLIRTTPTVIVAGDKDFSCGVEPSKWISQSIAGSKLVVIERAGHFAHVEQPGKFEDAVETFASMLK